MTALPRGWKRSEMGEIGRYLNGKAFKSQDWKSTGRPIIRIQNLTGSGTEFNYYQGEVEDRYVVQPGDLLFSWSATLGTYIWNGPVAVLNQHIFKVESNIDKRFHRYLLDFKIQEMQSRTHGSGMVHITKKSFDAIEVNIPPIEEQHKIVELLEDHLSRFDAALVDVKQAKIKAAQFRRSILQAAFSGTLTAHGPRSVTSLPDGWAHSSIGNLCKSVTKIDPINLGRDSFKYVDIGSLEPSSSSLENVEAISTKDAPGRARQLLAVGDSIFSTVRPYMKKVAYISQEFDGEIASTGFCVMRPNEEELHAKYLFYFLLSDDLLDQVLPLQRGVSYPAIRDNDLRNASIPLPPPTEQQRIVSILEDHFSRLEASIKMADDMEKQAAALRRSLLQSAFTGQLTKEVESV